MRNNIDADSLSLCSFRMHHFVRRTTYVSFQRFGGDVWREFMQRLFAAFHGTISATLRRRAVLTLWHAFVFLGLRFSPLFSFRLVVSAGFSCK
jgi:hypothetical protein